MSYNEDDMFLALLVALTAYEKENGEPFSVSKDVLSAVYEKQLEDGHITPTLGFTHTNDNRFAVNVVFEEASVESE